VTRAVVYAIQGGGADGVLVTDDGVVQHASPNFEWACGEPIDSVLDFLRRQRVRWSVSDALPRGMLLAGGVAIWSH
jgi:hypothetical protein